MKVRAVSCLVVLLAFAPIAGAQAIVITTDDTWKAIAVDPGPATDWRDSVLFDDSSWGDAVLFPAVFLNGDSVDGIWVDGSLCGGASVDAWFRKVFNLADLPSYALLSIGVDDDAQVYLNGNLVIDDQNGTANGTFDVDVASFLVAGQNLLAVHAADSAGGCRTFGLRLAASDSCGSGTIDSGEQCDDGNLSNGDCCSADCQAEVGNPCGSDGNECTLDVCSASGTCGTPPTGCKAAGKSLLLIKNNADDHTRDKLIWKWIQGEATSLEDFGSPNAATWHTLCLQSADGSSYVSVPAGTDWEVAGTKGYKFKSTSLSHGVQKALLKSGGAGNAKVLVKGKGENLPDSPAPELTLPVTARLVNNSNGVCFEAVYEAGPDVIKNEPGLFKAKEQ